MKFITLPLNKSLLFALLSMVFIPGLVKAQDVHLSQFDAAPLFYNPALSGNFQGEHRFIGNFKEQWKTFGTFLMSYDHKIDKEAFELGGGQIGVGGMLLGDMAGENNYGKLQLKVIPAWHKELDPQENMLRLSVGANLSCFFNNINEGSIVTQSNIDNSGTVTPGYELDRNKGLNADLDLGVNLFSVLNKSKVYPTNLGITFHHLFKSGPSFLEDGTSIDKARLFTINANSEIPIGTSFQALPSIIYAKQSKFYELNMGSFFGYDLTKNGTASDPKFYMVYLGSWYRLNDAVIAAVGVKGKGARQNHWWRLSLSYDITVSSYNELKTRGYGDSFEFSFMYVIERAEFKYIPPEKIHVEVM